jgi:hypothetical protein
MQAWEANACLLWNGQLLRWTGAGSKETSPHRNDLEVTVLTPESTVRTSRSGFVPIAVRRRVWIAVLGKQFELPLVTAE